MWEGKEEMSEKEEEGGRGGRTAEKGRRVGGETRAWAPRSFPLLRARSAMLAIGFFSGCLSIPIIP